MAYMVTAGMVTVEMDVPDVPGARALRDAHRGDVLPESVPAETIGRLLGLGEIAEVEADSESDADAGAEEDGEPENESELDDESGAEAEPEDGGGEAPPESKPARRATKKAAPKAEQ